MELVFEEHQRKALRYFLEKHHGLKEDDTLVFQTPPMLPNVTLVALTPLRRDKHLAISFRHSGPIPPDTYDMRLVLPAKDGRGRFSVEFPLVAQLGVKVASNGTLNLFPYALAKPSMLEIPDTIAFAFELLTAATQDLAALLPDRKLLLHTRNAPHLPQRHLKKWAELQGWSVQDISAGRFEYRPSTQPTTDGDSA